MRFLGFVVDRSLRVVGWEARLEPSLITVGVFFFFSCNFEKIPGANALSLVISTT